MSASSLVSRLEAVRQTRRNSWIARCPAHDDRGPSLAVRQTDDGRVLVHCFAGCSVNEVVGAVGLAISELFPPRLLDGHFRKPERRAIAALDILRCIAREVLIVSIAAMRLGNGHPLTGDDSVRLLLAAARIGAAVDLAEAA